MELWDVYDENRAKTGNTAVRGEGLHIERIDLDSGQLEVRGKVQELSYDESAPKGTLWSRLFGG